MRDIEIRGAATLPTETVPIGLSIREDSGLREEPGRILVHFVQDHGAVITLTPRRAPRKSNQSQTSVFHATIHRESPLLTTTGQRSGKKYLFLYSLTAEARVNSGNLF